MMLPTSKILDLVDPAWQSRRVLVVAYPAPPFVSVDCSVGDLVYPLEGWASSTIDRAIDIFHDTHGHMALTGKMTKYGPTFLMSYHLDQLIKSYDEEVNNDYWYEEGASMQTYCAGTSFAKYEKKGSKVVIADRTILESFTPISSSCHPGSHLSAPRSPHLTAFMQLGNNHRQQFILSSPDEAESFFPDIDFTGNAAVDELFKFVGHPRSATTLSHLSSQVAPASTVLSFNAAVYDKLRESKNAVQEYVDRVRLRMSFSEPSLFTVS